MKLNTIHIRNMCCQRCIDAVQDELKSLKIKVISVKLGQAIFEESKNIYVATIESALNSRGFVVIKDEEEILMEYVKTSIMDLVRHLSDVERKAFSLSVFLEGKMKMPYRNLLAIFKKHKGITIEKYFILQKIEKVKDLLENSSMPFSEIADTMGYKSPQHLSSQFKNITGITMQKFKGAPDKKRSFIDQI